MPSWLVIGQVISVGMNANWKSIREALTIAWSQQSPVLGIRCNYIGRVCEAESVFLSWECGTVHQYSVANSMCSKWSESVRLITWPCQNNPEPDQSSQPSITKVLHTGNIPSPGMVVIRSFQCRVGRLHCGGGVFDILLISLFESCSDRAVSCVA